MNCTSVPNTPGILEQLRCLLAELTPELHKAAIYTLEHPYEIGISSIREVAAAANVKPNTYVRLAQTLGFHGYEDFRQPFRQHIRQQSYNFSERARNLQSLAQDNQLTSLFHDMVHSANDNIQATFRGIQVETLKQIADAIVAARCCYVLGVGVNQTLARNFSYLAGMALGHIRAIPQDAGSATDALAYANPQDLLLAMTFKPYRREVVEAVEVAWEQGVPLVAISDSLASPIFTKAQWRLTVHTDTPQFFPSTVATLALLETLVAFIVADADLGAIVQIQRVHERRHRLGIYTAEPFRFI